MALVSFCDRESVRTLYFGGRRVQIWRHRGNGCFFSKGYSADIEYQLNEYGPVPTWVVDVYNTKTLAYVDDMGCPLALLMGASPVGMYHGEVYEFCKIVELKQRVARVRSLCLSIGKISLFMKRFYDEISFRPNHSGAAAARANFYRLVEQQQQSLEVHASLPEEDRAGQHAQKKKV